jgi:hypothetical protein
LNGGINHARLPGRRNGSIDQQLRQLRLPGFAGLGRLPDSFAGD